MDRRAAGRMFSGARGWLVMRHDGVWVERMGAAMGEVMSAEEAVAAGVCGLREVRRSGQESVPVATGLTGPQLAVRAGRQVLREQSGVDWHWHATIHDPGMDFWSPSAYVAHQLGLDAGVSLSVNAMSNSVVVGMELAAAVLSGRSDGSVLMTAGDTFRRPRFDAWRSDPGIVYGDGGCAVLLGSGRCARPVAELVATASYADVGLEGLHRGNMAWYCGAISRPPVRLRNRKAQWLATRGGRGELDRRNAVGVATVTAKALQDAGVEWGEVRWVLCPHYGDALLRRHCLEPLGISEERTTAYLGRRLGHMGAADQVVDLHDLIQHGRLVEGDVVLLLGIGVGMTFTAAVLRCCSGVS